MLRALAGLAIRQQDGLGVTREGDRTDHGMISMNIFD